MGACFYSFACPSPKQMSAINVEHVLRMPMEFRNEAAILPKLMMKRANLVAQYANRMSGFLIDPNDRVSIATSA